MFRPVVFKLERSRYLTFNRAEVDSSIRLKKYSDKLNIVHNSNILRNQNVSVEQPTVSYEVPDLEYVLLNYYKILLRVPRSSVNAAVRGELGAFPL